MNLRELLESRAGEDLETYSSGINPQFVKILRTIGFDREWKRTSGAYLYDSEGERYLDLLGGFGMFNVGRNNPRVRQALVDAMELEVPNAIQLGVSPLPGLLAEALLARAPAGLGKVLFTSSGTEAVEAAIKLGRAAAGRPRVVSAEHGFHGLTLGSLSLNGNAEFTDRFGPLLPGCDKVPWNDLEALELELARGDVALLVLEPVQGKGANLPAAGYLEGAQQLCRKHGTLFCVDEVQTGLGRTGRFLALEHWGLEPDLVTVSKSLSGGYIPSGALLMRDEVFFSVFDSLEHAVSHGSTFAPNDYAMVAGLATLAELDEQDLVANSERLGKLLLERTQPLVERFDVVAEVRGLGLMWAIEFHEPERGRRSFRLLERVQPGLFSQLVVVPLFRDHQILSQVAGHNMNVIKILPPLVIDESDVDWFVDALETVLERSRGLPREMVGFALRAARAR
ncbi:MAG TPA: aspartate aminotransferase family protein [Gaiellaceae bacterium]|nr:aspartate aminotransferase family protein [Gaiellaceae bacterium]